MTGDREPARLGDGGVTLVKGSFSNLAVELKMESKESEVKS